jgi:hypothetical protein
MDNSVMIAIGIIVVLVFIVWVFVIVSRKQAATKKAALLSRLHQLAREHDTTIGPSDILGARVIALDKEKGRIFYVDGSGDTTLTQVFDIESVSHCEVVSAGRRMVTTSGKGKPKTDEHIDKVLVEVSIKGGGKVSLLFYDEARDGVFEMLPLRQKAEKWKGLIKN